MVERVTRLNLWDKRTTAWSARCEKANAYAQDFGGWDVLREIEKDSIWFLTDVKMILDSIIGRVQKDGGPVTPSGELHPSLRKGFIAYKNTYRLDAQFLEEMRRARPAPGPSLQEYIAARASAPQNAAPGSTQGTPSPAPEAAPSETQNAKANGEG